MLKKALSPVISTTLLLVFGVLFSYYIIEYNFSSFSNLEATYSPDSLENSLSSQNLFSNFKNDILYLENSNSQDITLSKIMIGQEICLENVVLNPGINQFDISSCYSSQTTDFEQIYLYKDSSIEVKSVFVASLSGGASCTDANLIASNIKQGIEILGVLGTYVPTSVNLTASNIKLGVSIFGVAGSLAAAGATIVDSDGDLYVNQSATDSVSFAFINSSYGYGADCDDSNVSISSADDGTCDGDGDGYIDFTAGGIDYRDDDALSTYPLRSCKEIYDLGGTSGQGIYTIDPDGVVGGTAPFDVYCDLTNGGWTLIARQIVSIANSNLETASSYGTLTNSTQNTDAKFSDSLINLIANYSADPIYKQNCSDRINYYQTGFDFDATRTSMGTINISTTSADSGYFAVVATYTSCSKGLHGCDYSAGAGWGANAGNSPASVYSGESGFGLTYGCAYSDAAGGAGSWVEASGNTWVR